MRRRLRPQRRRGYSLIELLVALALVSVVLAVAGTILLQAYANEASYREQNEAQQNARAAADSLADDLRGTIKRSDNAIPAGPIIVSSDSPLIFDIRNERGEYRTVRYRLDGTNLVREVGPSRSSVIERRAVVARNIRDLPRLVRDNNVVTIVVTATVGNPPYPSRVTVRSDVTLRNYLLPG